MVLTIYIHILTGIFLNFFANLKIFLKVLKVHGYLRFPSKTNGNWKFKSILSQRIQFKSILYNLAILVNTTFTINFYMKNYFKWQIVGKYLQKIA